MQRWIMQRWRQSFTLIELLVVITIIAILVAMFFPGLANAQARSREARCRSNAKSISAIFLMVAQDNDRRYPPGPGNPLLLMSMPLLTNQLNTRAVLRCLSDKGTTSWPVVCSKSCYDSDPNASSYMYAAATYSVIGLTNIAGVSIGQISSPSRKAVIVEPCLNSANTKFWHRRVGFGTVGFVDGHADLVDQVTSIIETNAYY